MVDQLYISRQVGKVQQDFGMWIYPRNRQSQRKLRRSRNGSTYIKKLFVEALKDKNCKNYV